jgi:hypothetical protein
MLRVLLAACCTTALLAGCGGGGTIQRQHFASSATFAAAANDVCARSKTRGTRLARLYRLVPPPPDRDLFDHWLRAEQAAVEASRANARRPAKAPPIDPQVELAVAEGKIAGYSRRLGVRMCAGAPGVTMPS